MKELRFNSPDKKHPGKFKLKDLWPDPKTDEELIVFIEWEDGTYGSKTPVIIIRSADNG